MGRAGRGPAHGAGDTQHGVVFVRVSGVDSKEQSPTRRSIVQESSLRSLLLER